MIVRGPFALTWNGTTLIDIEAVDIEYDTQGEDYESGSGIVFEVERALKASIRLTLLATDITTLAAVLPQYFVPEDGQLGDGNFVFDSRGAIDIIPDNCASEPIYSDLEIVACGDPTERFKLMNARTVIDGFEIGKIRKLVVKFIGEPAPGHSLIQLLGDTGEDDFFMLDNPAGGGDELFLLDNDENLIL